jgi:hypothetical protein
MSSTADRRRTPSVEPLWREGEKWENFQRRKHRPEVLGRDAERKLP